MRCFKNTEPENNFNTVVGDISDTGYLKWKILPPCLSQAEHQPYMFFQIQMNSKILRTKVALVDEKRVLPPMTYDVSLPEPVGAKQVPSKPNFCSSNERVDSADGTAVMALDAGVAMQDSESGSQVDRGDEDLGVERQMFEGQHASALSSETVDLEGEIQGDASPVRRPQRRVAQALNTAAKEQGDLDTSTGVHYKEGRRVGHASHPNRSSQAGKSHKLATVHATDLHEEGQNGSEFEDESGENSDSDPEWDIGDNSANSDGQAESIEEGGEPDDLSEGSRSSGDGDSDSVSNAGPKTRLKDTDLSTIDPNKIEEDGSEIEDHRKDVIAEHARPLYTVIAEKNYKDSSRDRPIGLPSIHRGKVRGCQQGEIIIVSNEYLKSLNLEFFSAFEPFAFHVCEVVGNSDTEERLKVKRLIPISIQGQHCSQAAKDGVLKTMLEGRKLTGPFIYTEGNAEMEQNIIIDIDHCKEAEEKAILVTLKPADNDKHKNDCGDYAFVGGLQKGFGTLVLCDPGQFKIKNELKSREQALLDDPQLQSWDDIRKMLTIEGFFGWVEEFHSQQAAAQAPQPVKRDKVWRSMLYDGLTADVRILVGLKESFLSSLGRKANFLSKRFQSVEDHITSIAGKVAHIAQNGGDGQEGNGPLDGVSNWTTLFCIDTAWGEETSSPKRHDSISKYEDLFMTYISRSLEYYVDGDVVIFSGKARPTPQVQKIKHQHDFPVVVLGTIIEVVCPWLGKKCSLQVNREKHNGRVCYSPSIPSTFEKPPRDYSGARYFYTDLHCAILSS